MQKTLTFDEFWELANPDKDKGNGPSHHLCCDIWTTRSSKVKRATHVKRTQWRHLVATFDKDFTDKKQALLKKMTENGWRIPLVVNKTCQNQPKLSFGRKKALKNDQLRDQAQELQDSFTHLEFAEIESDHPIQLTSGIIYIYKFVYQSQLLFCKRKTCKTSLFFPSKATLVKASLET